MNDIKGDLKELGFADYESRILLFLIKSNSYMTAKEIQSGSGVPMGKIYSILKDLENDKLILRLSDNVDRFSVESRRKLFRQIHRLNEKKIDEKRRRLSSSFRSFRDSIDEIPEIIKEHLFKYYTNDDDYWTVYNAEVARLGKNDIYRIINCRRLSTSFLNSELENNPEMKKMILQDNNKIRKGMKLHLITNPRSVVKNIFNELNDKELGVRAVNKMVKRFSNPTLKKNIKITIAPEFKDLILVIIRNNVFIEFYEKKSNHISSAIHINSSKISSDMGKWFDGFSDKNSENDLFERMIIDEMKKIIN